MINVFTDLANMNVSPLLTIAIGERSAHDITYTLSWAPIVPFTKGGGPTKRRLVAAGGINSASVDTDRSTRSFEIPISTGS